MFAREVNENAEMIAALEGAILFNVDCEKGEGPELAKKYEIRGYPTYHAVNGKGEITDSWIGYDGPGKWSASLIAAKADRRTLAEKKTAFETEPTLELAKALASAASTGSDYKGAVTYLGKALELDEANAKDYNAQILSNMIYGLEDDSFTMDQVAAKVEPVMASDDTPVDEKLYLALMLRHFAGQKGEMDKAVPIIAAAYEASEGTTDEKALKYRGYLDVSYALLVEKDKDKALGIYRDRLPEGWEEDPGRLNDFAFWCFENDVNLDEAQDWALKAVELAETDEEKANSLDTLAEICSALGNCDEALAHIQRAIELDPDRDYFKDQLVRFQEEC